MAYAFTEDGISAILNHTPLAKNPNVTGTDAVATWNALTMIAATVVRFGNGRVDGVVEMREC
jgi:hypothetical protein